MTVTLTVHLAWWLRLYLEGVILVAILTGREPDWQKVRRVVVRGIRIR